MALPAVNTKFKRVGVGQLYLAVAPTTATDAEDYYAVFFGAGGAAAKKTLTGGVVPFANLTDFSVKIKPSTVDFDPLAGTKTKVETGIEEATAEFSFYDLDPAHLNFMYGAAAADLITEAAATGVAGRKTALIGPGGNQESYVAMFRMPSPIEGEFSHYLLTNCSLVSELDLKFDKKSALQGKITLQLDVSPFLFNSKGFGVVMISDDPSTPAI